MDSDAEWVGVDFEFGAHTTTTTTPRPRPRPRPRPTPPRPAATEPPGPHDAPEIEPGPSGDSSVGLVVGSVCGVLSLALVLVLVYLLVLRRKLTKAKKSDQASTYQLRVEDVAHLSHLDDSCNTYVNTTDLQKLVASVKAKASDQRPTTTNTPQPLNKPPRPLIQHSPHVDHSNEYMTMGNQVVVINTPAPLPVSSLSRQQPDVCSNEVKMQSAIPSHNSTTSSRQSNNLHQPFKLAPPPVPVKQNKTESAAVKDAEAKVNACTVIARPAPPPPSGGKSQVGGAKPTVPQHVHNPEVQKFTFPTTTPQSEIKVSKTKPLPNVPTKPLSDAAKPPLDTTKLNPLPEISKKPTPPSVALKPTSNKPGSNVGPLLPPSTKPTVPAAAKPVPPTLPKPSAAKKGRALAPLKMVLQHPPSADSPHLTDTPDTAMTQLGPDTPADEGLGAAASISARIAFLEGKMNPRS